MPSGGPHRLTELPGEEKVIVMGNNIWLVLIIVFIVLILLGVVTVAT
jgi:hypothetical protein